MRSTHGVNAGARRLAALAIVVLAALLVFALGPHPEASAHEFRPAVLALEETAPGDFDVQWRPPQDAQQRDLPLAPRFPEHCALDDGGHRLTCGAAGLRGELSFPALDSIDVEVVVRVTWLDDSSRTRVLRPDAPTLSLDEDRDAAATGEVAWDYLRLGVEHILGGIDHLLFVVGLLLLVGFERRLLWTITGFTIAHSITLATSVLGLLSLPQAPVEAVIALSILLVAVEVGRDEPSLSREHPEWVAFGFGLLHGFGFSGALQEIGLPEGQLPVALLTFNVGVELGQLLVVALAFGAWWLALRRLPERITAPLMRAAAYGLGTVAAFWTIQRVVALWS